jgi:hypothetical protein
MAAKQTPSADDAPTTTVADAPAAPVLDPAMMALVQALAQTMAQGQLATAQAIREQNGPRDNPMGSPLISEFNPAGDRDHPRPDLRCPVTFCGAECPRDCFTVEEIDLINTLEAGVWSVQKSDGTMARFAVVPTVDQATGTWTKLDLSVDAKDHDSNKNWPPLVQMLAQIQGLPVPQRAVFAPRRLSGGANPAQSFGPGVGLAAQEQLLKDTNPMVRRDMAALLAKDAERVA